MIVMQYLRSVAIAATILSATGLSAPAHAGGGDAALAGVAGFAVGTLFGSAVSQPRYYPGTVYVAPAPPPVVYEPTPVYYAPAPWSPEWYAYCARKYGSFDARSGTFLGLDGYRHTCM
jgi:hypothetical protein